VEYRLKRRMPKEEFVKILIFGDTEGFKDELDEVDGGDSDKSDEGGIALIGAGDENEDVGADL
ncbi:hypothetical protein HOY82DRAFT_483797, partial [Tuber indicum]